MFSDTFAKLLFVARGPGLLPRTLLGYVAVSLAAIMLTTAGPRRLQDHPPLENPAGPS